MSVAHLERLPDLLFHCVVGSGLILAATAGGWWVGRRPERRTVRVVSWWLRHVVRPLLACRSWARRAATIAINNALICATVVALGAWGPVAWLAVGAVGLGLGIALRLLLASPPEPEGKPPPPTGGHRVAGVVGVALNLLEVPAIALSAGLCLAQAAMSPVIDWTPVWHIFGAVVLPALVIAAAGEALWMGVYPP